MFIPRSAKPQIDDHPVWTPDTRYLLYQHRTYSLAADGFSPTGFDQARQIIQVDAQTGEQTSLLSDPAYDFHLGSCPSCAEWYGDWIPIRRVAFMPEPIEGGEAMATSQAFTCRMYAQDCAAPVELFALNWKTGELVPWTDMFNSGLVPDPNLTATPIGPNSAEEPLFEQPDQYTLYTGPREHTFWIKWRYAPEGAAMLLAGPDLDSKPIYQHPSGDYAYYLGIDDKSLWMVPREGLPLPWVFNGQNYFYLGTK
jgi:hypothetical protein